MSNDRAIITIEVNGQVRRFETRPVECRIGEYMKYEPSTQPATEPAHLRGYKHTGKFYANISEMREIKIAPATEVNVPEI